MIHLMPPFDSRRIAFLLCLFAAPHAHAQQLLAGNDFTFKGCYAHRNGNQLVLGNSHLRRAWRIEDGHLFATSIFDLDTNTEWVGLPPALPSPTPPVHAASGQLTLRGAGGTFGLTEAPSLRIELDESAPGSSVQYEFQIFPQASGIRTWVIESNGKTEPTNSETLGEPIDDALEHLLITNTHLRLTQVTMHDRTDDHDELVQEAAQTSGKCFSSRGHDQRRWPSFPERVPAAGDASYQVTL